MNPSRSVYVPTIIVTLLLAGLACSSKSKDDAGQKDSGTGDSQSVCTQSCDDGHDCTVDTCVSNKCQHSIGPKAGATACLSGQYCTLDSGCVAAPACSTADQCVADWKDDACKVNIKCEAASSVCTFDLLDKDGDGHSPKICGGDDCNDNNASIHPGAAEKCNGVDDDCDGVVDEDDGSTPLCGKLSVCTNGTCTCKPEFVCGTTCTDVSTDPGNCGSCGHSCGTNTGAEWICVSGQCQCSGDACGTVCTVLQSDNANCGACGTVCAALDVNSWCQTGQCGRHCMETMSLTCSSNEVCRYTSANGSECIPDPCPGQALSCDAPCNADNNCAPCNAWGRGNLRCQ